MRISIGNDHAGPEYKKAIVEMLEKSGHTIKNYGTDSAASVDYPDFGHPVATDVENGNADFGIVICGSGNGINMTVNKHSGVRNVCENLRTIQAQPHSAKKEDAQNTR